MDKKYGLVLSGGAAKGAFQAGVLKGILERGEIKPWKVYSGISVGCINAAEMACASTPEIGVKNLLKEWRNLSANSVYRNRFLGALNLLWSNSVYDTSPLENYLKSRMSSNAVKKAGNTLVCGVVDMMGGQYIEVNQDSEPLHEWIRASASFPGAFPPVEIDGRLYLDGGIQSMTPLASAIREGCTDITVIITNSARNVDNLRKHQLKTGFQILSRTLELMLDASWARDLRTCSQINRQVEEGKSTKRHINIDIYSPKKPFNCDLLGFKRDELDSMIREGELCRSIVLEEYLRYEVI
jgi:predicted acylesterase/phospholipase RssA